MASDSSESCQYDIENEELEDLEVIEIDEALLRSLLDESENVDAKHDSLALEYATQSPEAENDSNNMIEERKGCLEQHALLQIHDFDGLDMMDMAPMFPIDEMETGYVDDPIYMANFGYDVGDYYSQVHDEFSFNETAYNCLWEDI